MNPFKFGIVGSGWRSEFFLRAAKEIPDRLSVSGMVIRDSAKGSLFEKKWQVPTFRTVEELAKTKPDFVILSVPWKVTPEMILWFSEKKIPVLAETPPAPDIEGIEKLMSLVDPKAKIQVAEQYPFQPHLAASIEISRSGKLGEINQAQISVAHGYHGMAILRALLGIGRESATIQALNFESNVAVGPGRGGDPTSEEIKKTSQTIAHLRFGSKLAVFDFASDQYFSWIRSQRILVRGERGEIHNQNVRYLKDFKTPVHLSFDRRNAGENGDLEGYSLKGIKLGEDWIYQNPFPGARLSDEEIAIAVTLVKMGEYSSGGKSFYSLADGAYDHYLGLLISKAAQSGEITEAPLPSWAN